RHRHPPERLFPRGARQRPHHHGAFVGQDAAALHTRVDGRQGHGRAHALRPHERTDRVPPPLTRPRRIPLRQTRIRDRCEWRYRDRNSDVLEEARRARTAVTTPRRPTALGRWHMQITLSVIKADIGSIGGHICPSAQLFETVRRHVAEAGRELLIDSYVSFTGDDIAIMMSHTHGLNDERVHKLAWDAFVAGTETAKRQGLYGAGQDLLKDAFSGNLHGLGPAVAEMRVEEGPYEPFLFFAADKTDPGAYNLPLYLAFADPMTTPGLILAPSMAQGFRFVIMDVNYTEGDRVIELNAPEDLYDIATLLRDPERYVVESVWSRASGEQAVAVATSRLHNIAGKYTGKDDPVMLVRVQKNFPATGEVLAPYATGHFVAGGMRGSHNMPLMPV